MNRIPESFFWRRLHSLMGLWLVLFLLQHLLTNSRAALLIGNDGYGFVKAVNAIHDLPYLAFIEAFLLGIPFLTHIVWGIKYLRTGKPNHIQSDGSTPALGNYSRNHAYSWQRITSWLLLVGVVAHVVQMRFLNYPTDVGAGQHQRYLTILQVDDGLYTMSDRLEVELYDSIKVKAARREFFQDLSKAEIDADFDEDQWLDLPLHAAYDPMAERQLVDYQNFKEQSELLELLEEPALKENQVIAVSNSFGTATLLVVRETFKSPMMIALYSLFVLAACFHAFNGLWTFLITWGFALTPESQKLMLKGAMALMLLVAFLGFASIWGTYWVNLRY